MKAFGQHLLVEYKKCDREILNDKNTIEKLMQAAALASETTIVQSVFHPFFPQGISGVVVIEESHLSIHTWPEFGYAAVDFFTCGKGVPEKAHEVLKNGLKAGQSEVMLVHRGLLDENRAMSVRSHTVEEETAEMMLLSETHADMPIDIAAAPLLVTLRQASK